MKITKVLKPFIRTGANIVYDQSCLIRALFSKPEPGLFDLPSNDMESHSIPMLSDCMSHTKKEYFKE